MYKYFRRRYVLLAMNRKNLANLSIKKTFGLTVRMFRYKAEMSQEQLAEKSHLHPTYISSIERGERSVGLEKIVYIARALGISPKDLMPE